MSFSKRINELGYEVRRKDKWWKGDFLLDGTLKARPAVYTVWIVLTPGARPPRRAERRPGRPSDDRA